MLSYTDRTCMSLRSSPLHSNQRLKDTRVTATVRVLIGQEHVEILMYHNFTVRHSVHIYNRTADLSHSVDCMKPNLQGLMWCECREMSKEENC